MSDTNTRLLAKPVPRRKVRMLKTISGGPSPAAVETHERGQLYALPKRQADSYIAHKWAEAVDDQDQEEQA